MKRFSIIMIAVLCIALTGFCSYSIYAAITSTMTAKNVISFRADDDIYYRATVEIVYKDLATPFASDVVDHSGIVETHDASKTTMVFNDAIRFTKAQREIWYNIVVENFSEYPISVRAYPPTSNQYLTNTINIADAVVVPARVLGEDLSTAKFRISSKLNSVRNSFEFDNSFYVYIEKAQA